MLLLGRCFGSATKDVREKICKDHGSKTDSLKTEKIKQKQKQTGGGRRRPSEQRLQRQAAAPVSAERRGSVTPPSAGKLDRSDLAAIVQIMVEHHASCWSGTARQRLYCAMRISRQQHWAATATAPRGSLRSHGPPQKMVSRANTP